MEALSHRLDAYLKSSMTVPTWKSLRGQGKIITKPLEAFRPS